jgi:hypothetical protein
VLVRPRLPHGLLLAAGLLSCSTSPTRPGRGGGSSASESVSSASAVGGRSAASGGAASHDSGASPGGASAPHGPAGADRGPSPASPGAIEPAIDPGAAASLLFLDAADAEAASCQDAGEAAARIRCMIGKRYRTDPAAGAIALALYQRTGDVAGVEREQWFDGDWRGTIKLVPELPIGPYRRHLAWVAAACEDFEQFGSALARRAPRQLAYRTSPLALRFLRSVGRTTPSAYAEGWVVSYNVSGSLHSSAQAVRETLFHEIFHLNDAAHRQWSARALPALVDPVIARCRRAGHRLDSSCLAPFAPGSTMVRGGTYYAFYPGNGVGEYAAELASRYYREQRAALGMPDEAPQQAPKQPFKCGPAPNGPAWQLMVDEFFGGADLTAACP